MPSESGTQPGGFCESHLLAAKCVEDGVDRSSGWRSQPFHQSILTLFGIARASGEQRSAGN
jgi:hypothetical protein